MPASFRRASRISKPLLVAVLATFASLALAEVSLRLLDLPAREATFRFATPEMQVDEVFLDYGRGLVADEDLIWRLEPTAPVDHVNRLGMRGWWPRREKGPRDLRIACVGDSCTFGVGVRYEDTYGLQLERRVQERLPRHCVETVLAGLPGYSSLQSRLLWERHVAALRPDLTVLYLGAWNDWLPAVGASDAERRARSHPLLRLAALARRVASPARPAEFYAEAFRRGEAPDGRRVPLPDFERHVRALIEDARAAGSDVVLVVPPVPERTLERHPAGRDYIAAVRAVAAAAGVATVDGGAALAPLGRSAFLDWVHPSAAGPRRLAEALADAVAPMLPEETLAAPAVPPRLGAPEPPVVPDLGIARVRIPVEELTSFDRLWIGPRWLDDARLEDGTITARWLTPLPAGSYPIEVVGRLGAVRAPAPLLVRRSEPLPLRVSARREGERARVVVTMRVPEESLCSVWLAPARREEPVSTQHGAWWLAEAGEAAEPAGDDDGFRFDVLPFARATGLCVAGGEFVQELTVEADALAGGLWAQGVVRDHYDPDLGRTTDVARVRP